MSNGVNKVILIGNAGKDPEKRILPGEISVCSFNLATNEIIGDKKHTEWHNVVGWRGIADSMDKLIRKGDTVYVEGKLKSRTYKPKEGNERLVVEVVIDNFIVVKKSFEE